MAKHEGFHRIVVAVDGSVVSLRAADRAARIAREDHAELFAVYVVPTPPSEVPGELADYYEQVKENARVWLTGVETAATEHGVGLRTEVLVGAVSVVDAVLGFAESIDADLIVTGTRGRTASSRLRIGSVASGLVEYAKSAVLVIR